MEDPGLWELDTPPHLAAPERTAPAPLRPVDRAALDEAARRRERIIVDLVKLAACVAIGIAAAWLPLIHVMLMGYLLADGLVWFVRLLGQFAAGIFVGLAEAIGYLLLFAWLGKPTAGLIGDPAVFALGAGVFVMTAIAKVSVWLEAP